MVHFIDALPKISVIILSTVHNKYLIPIRCITGLLRKLDFKLKTIKSDSKLNMYSHPNPTL